ncbi:tetratricopeptide repeat protein [Arthrobacter sp. ISL-28]|uniref:tetratricopeptide repeat protein n=1 Tax=Arthrobacter sp. ISL-28 TaxID=2819108 RepID=UPI001BE5C303|nr:tetratricopeptide repeat protein [Arthrobacter sp. ISL-28]MBT2520037.1 tetratricopeptide repeat protein [Arthrobacter sp. ISL-28]
MSVLETLAQFAADSASHSEAQRRCDEALTLLEHAEPSATRDERRVAILVHKGNSQRLSARYEESSITLAHALALSEPLQVSVASVGPLNALGILAKDRGRYEEAATYYNRALKLLAAKVGGNAPDMASLFHNLAGLNHVQGQFVQAEEPARKAVRLRRAARPPDPVGLAADLSVLGAVLAGQERFNEATVVLSEALNLWRNRYGEEHYEVAVQLHNLAAIQQAQQDYLSSEATFRRALAIKQSILGPSHPEIAVILNNLGTLYSDIGRTREAMDCYEDAITIFKQTLGDGHPSTDAAIQNRNALAKLRSAAVTDEAAKGDPGSMPYVD